MALSNPNAQPATINFYFTDSSGRDFNPGAITVPANGQIARFLDEAPFSVPGVWSGTWTFSSDVAVGAIALRGFTNERSEFLMTTLKVVEPGLRPSSTVVFPQFAVGGGWSTEILLLNPVETTLTGTVSVRSAGLPDTNYDYSIPPKSARAFTVSLGNASDPPGLIRSGMVRVFPTAGLAQPDGSLVLSFKNGPTTVSSIGMGAAGTGSRFHVYAESSQFVQTGIAIANPSDNAAVVGIELIAASGETVGSATIAVPADGQVAMFMNEISGLPTLRSFEGMLRISTTSTAGVAVVGLRGRYNERGDFLITATPPAEEINAASTLFPHIIDGGGYSTQFVLLRTMPVQAPAGSLQFNTQGGQPLELSLR